jgi:DNA-binding NarL/FixJ family response regulator
MSAKIDLVGIIEAAYRLDLDDRTWLDELVRAVGPHFDRGKGVYGFCFDASEAERFRIWGMTVVDDAVVIPELVEAWHAALHPQQVWRMYRGPLQFASISQRLGSEEPGQVDLDAEAMRRFCRRIGIIDQLTLRGVDPTYAGVAVCTPMEDAAVPTAAESRRWTQIAAHVSSAFRLRRQLADTARGLEGADAVCTPDGRVVHAETDARENDTQESLREAVVAIDKARSKLRREEPDHAVDIWRGLVAGTWTLVEHFESDGRRYLVARKNSPSAEDPRALSERERQAVHYATLGHSTKETAYALGMSDATVGVHLWSAMKKLGVGSRVELVRLMSSLSDASRAPASSRR